MPLKPTAFRTFFPRVQKAGQLGSGFWLVMFDYDEKPFLIEEEVAGALATIPLEPELLERIHAHDHNFVYKGLVVFDLLDN